MASTIKRALRSLFAEAKKSETAMKKILNPPQDDSFAGSRIYPARHKKKDEDFGIRIDRGPSVKDKPNMVNINLQINSNAGKKSLQQLVKKHGSHKKFVTVQVDSQQEVTAENMDKLQEKIESEIDKIDGI
ncbi:hypothetical protein Aspvir_004828 [Aspergillus viridinutans]|uniref:Uncharacterized protein n=1 Tax=Aspergillus viridinutans TaxID=75553 RepID=A0A9P3BR49_ASPVI|nr:uncharacterized protein Aspvir_004828 [Aspergillus viridinutans]GIK00799.1 hypothetical protein Aspvir_004828 [Aspergillus viridinutans]